MNTKIYNYYEILACLDFMNEASINELTSFLLLSVSIAKCIVFASKLFMAESDCILSCSLNGLRLSIMSSSLWVSIGGRLFKFIWSKSFSFSQFSLIGIINDLLFLDLSLARLYSSPTSRSPSYSI